MCTCQNAKKKGKNEGKSIETVEDFSVCQILPRHPLRDDLQPAKILLVFFFFFFFFLLHGVDLENESIVAIDSRYSGNALATFGKRGEGRDINLLFLAGLTYFSVQKRNADERTNERLYTPRNMRAPIS
jgi:hypothetical protein